MIPFSWWERCSSFWRRYRLRRKRTIASKTSLLLLLTVSRYHIIPFLPTTRAMTHSIYFAIFPQGFHVAYLHGRWKCLKVGGASSGQGHGERVEREPITGVWGRSPQRGPGAEPLVRGSGGAPLKLKHFFASECSIETANSPIFLKFGNTKDHQTLLNFAILAGKWQKTHLFI